MAKFIGTFETSGKLLITDPCYSLGTWCTGKASVKPGKYHAFVEREGFKGWGIRNVTLTILHEKYKGDDWCFPHALPFDIGVDGGQCGFFEYHRYEKEQSIKGVKWDDPNTFFGKCAHASLSNESVGIIDNFGVVASSGFGDGSYVTYAKLDKDGNIVGLQLVFITEEDLREEENDS